MHTMKQTASHISLYNSGKHYRDLSLSLSLSLLNSPKSEELPSPMQGQRRTVQFFPETIENSSAPDIQQNIWSYSVDTSTQPFNVSEYLPARSETSINYDYRGLCADESYGGYGSYGSYEVSDNPWRTSSTSYGHPFSTHASSAGAMTASTSGSSSYSRLFVGDNIGSLDDADGYRFLDDRRHSSKRKNFEGQSSQSSGSSSSAAPSRGLSISESPSYNDISRNVEGSREDFSSAHRADAVSSRLLPPGMWPSNHYSPSLASAFPHLVSNANIPHLPPPSAPSVPQMGYPMTWNGGPNYRIESYNDLHASSRRETNPRGLERHSILERPDAGYFSAFQPVSNVLPASAPSWMPYQGVTGHANSLRTAASRPGIDFRTAQQQLRSAFLMGRQSGIMAAPVTLRSRRTRNMIIFEQIRNALELMQREDSIVIDDVMIMDESEYTDNYSDWRLDVDNMTYEELLALEERMGNVSTGLDESTVLKNMKQRKYLSLSACKPESCCICQEEYEDGEDLGVLSCGHDFHASCVRKWLVQKNICPVCKVTALSK